MQIPTTLKHKPVIVAEDYGNVDGRYAHNTDAKGVSLGLAQWNDRGKVEPQPGHAEPSDLAARFLRSTLPRPKRTVELSHFSSSLSTPPRK